MDKFKALCSMNCRLERGKETEKKKNGLMVWKKDGDDDGGVEREV